MYLQNNAGSREHKKPPSNTVYFREPRSDHRSVGSTTWRIIQQVNLEPLLHQGERLLDAWRSITQHCSNMVACRHQQQLKNIYKQVTDTNKEIDKALELLEGQGAQKATRIRRAWFSAVGKVSRYLFGTLDEA